MQPLLGAHVSIAGGVFRAVPRGTDLTCNAIQIFVKNASQWEGKPLTETDVERFEQELRDSEISTLVAHSTYLVNLAATNPDNLRRSRATLGDELDRCHRLGVPGLVVHPGAHLGAGEEKGIDRIAESLHEVFAARPECHTRVLLENTAGQGTLIGHRLEQLAAIVERAQCEGNLGLCVDTCHAFAAGHPIDDEAGYEAFFQQAQDLFGPDEPSCLHLNDSRHPQGSNKDRHANLGEGHLGLEVFERLVNDPRCHGRPMILETPLGDDGEGHRRDLELLRSFLP
ncbi:MAG: deoxyribonuclease IV [Thermoanaerobaculia bacterium]